MSSKEARVASSTAVAAGSSLRAETERLIAKERFKDAVKQAKLCYKESSSQEHHELLERAYFLRARQLLQMSMPSAAAEVAQHLLEFGVTAGDWVEEFVRLLVRVGLGSQAREIQERLGFGEMTDELATMAADLAVLHPERTGDVPPEVSRDAALVRQALEKLCARDDEAAFEALRGLARSSPLSEWKFFARGLAALYRHDPADVSANWDRLDPKRKAHAIAARLRDLLDGARGESCSEPPDALESLVFGEPIIGRLRQIGRLAAGHDWEELFRLLGGVNRSLRKVDHRLAERLTGVLLGQVVECASDQGYRAGQQLVREFTRSAHPLPIDPNWNRLWALVWTRAAGASDETLEAWTRYLDDLAKLTVLKPAEVALAQSLVWNRLAEVLLDMIEDFEEDDNEFPAGFGIKLPREAISPEEREEIDVAKREMIRCLERSIALSPSHLPTYEMLVGAYKDWRQDAAAEAAALRLLERFPEHAETLEQMAQLKLSRDDPGAALSFITRARALKPLDTALRGLEWNARIGLARQHALAKRWEEGRAELRAVEALEPETAAEFVYLAKKATFERKAREAAAADLLEQQALATLVEPGPLWLALLIESIRFRMSKAIQNGYMKLWGAELRKKTRSETAGGMASLLDAFVASHIEYPGRAAHIKKVVAYIERTKTLKYRRQDIEHVCEFLNRLGTEPPLFEKLVARGVEQHPDSVVLNFFAGLVNVGNSPHSMEHMRGRISLEKALKLAEASTDPKATALLPAIKATLTAFNEIGRRGLGYGAGWMDPAYMDDDDEFAGDDDWYEDGDDDEDDDDDDDWYFGPAPAQAPVPPSPRKMKKKKSRKKR
jgi:hypothetical protein